MAASGDRGYLVVGRVRNAHGLRGEFTVESLTDAPDTIFVSGRRVFAAGPELVPLAGGEVHISRATPFKGGYIVATDEVQDRTTAERWRDRYLVVPADELPPPADGEVYLYELPGMQVELGDGTVIGEVITPYELPQGVVIDVQRESGTVMIPFNEEIVVRVDREGRRLVVAPPDGLLD